MDPLRLEYLHAIDSVKSEIASFKLEKTELKNEIAKLYQENRKLANELRETLLIDNQKLSEKGVQDLEQKLLAANAAKETSLSMWQEAMKQLDTQEKLLIGKKSLVESERNEVTKSMDEIKEQYQKALSTLSSELTACRAELTGIKQQFQTNYDELKRSKIDLESTKNDLGATKQYLENISAAKKNLETQISGLQQALTEKEKMITEIKQENNLLKSKNLELSSSISSLEQQNNKMKQDIIVMEKNANESLIAAQEAILHKKEIAYREEQYLKEIEVLKSSTHVDVQKVEIKFSALLKEAQEKNNEKIHCLMEEIQLLHKEVGEKQSLFEKVERQKKALESELELLHNEIAAQAPNGGALFDELSNRFTLAEQSRDELELKVKSLQKDLEELKSVKEQEIKSLEAEKNVLKERVSSLSTDCNKAIANKLVLRDELTVIKKKYRDLEKEMKLFKTRHAQAISAMRDEAVRKELLYKEQMSTSEKHYKGLCSELRTLLENQFHLSNRWKSETEEVVSKSESKILDMCNVIARLEQENNELTTVIRSRNSLRNTTETFTDYKRKYK